MTLTIELTDAEYARLTKLAAETGRSPSEALRDRAGLAQFPSGTGGTIDPYPKPPPHPPEDAEFFADWSEWPEWKRGMFQAYGIWRDREDLDQIEDRSGRDRTERVWAEAHSSQTPEGQADLAKRFPGFDFTEIFRELGVEPAEPRP